MLTSTCFAHGAYAQTSEQAEEQGGSWAGEVVIVTGRRDGYVMQQGSSATRTDTPLIEVPQSVQVINSSLIADQDRRSLADALVNVSGVVATRPEESLVSQSLIRGFKSEIYLDGLPAYGINALVDPTSLTGVDRIEVVKGPTSTVYGGGAGAPLGGLVNVVSVRPHDDAFEGFVAIRGGSWNTTNPFADVNVPLARGVAMRVTGEYQDAESPIDEVNSERWSVQPSIAFGLGTSTVLTVMGKMDRRVLVDYLGIPRAALAGTIRRDVFAGVPSQPRSDVTNRFVTTELAHQFSDRVALTVTGRYYKNTADRYTSFTYEDFGRPAPATPTLYPIFKSHQPFEVEESTVDANLSVKAAALGGEHQLLIGANYDTTDYFSRLDFGFAPVGRLDLAAPDYQSISYGANPPTLSAVRDEFETLAAYVQDQASYGRLHLSGSLRYTSIEVTHRVNSAYNRTYDRVNPRVGATFDLVDGVALFAGYATGFRGAISFNPQPGQEVKPETSESYEAGLKFARSDVRLWGSLAAYELKRRNVPVGVPGQPGVSIQTGEQRARGVEADVTWEPVRSLSILANYAYTDAIVSADNTNLLGQELQRVPQHMGRVAAHYRFRDGVAKGFSLGFGVTGRSSYENYLPNQGRVAGYAIVDAQIAYDLDRWTVIASMGNLTNHDGFDAFNALTPVVMPIQPRSAYLTLKSRF